MNPTILAASIRAIGRIDACFWCGHRFDPHEYRPDHFLWCSEYPSG